MAKIKKQENTEVTTTSENTEVAAVTASMKFKLKKRITLPTFNPGVEVPYFIRPDEAFRVSTYVDPDPKKASEKPATICAATVMETGESVLWLIPEVVVKNLRESYPDDSYVGLIFACKKMAKRPGKRYFDFQIAEVEMDEDGDEEFDE